MTETQTIAPAEIATLVDDYSAAFITALTGGETGPAAAHRRTIVDQLDGRTATLFAMEAKIKQTIRAIIAQRQPDLTDKRARQSWEDAEATGRRHYMSARENLIIALEGAGQ